MNNSIGTSTPITIGLLIACAGALIAGGGALAKLDTHSDRLNKLDAQVVELNLAHNSDIKESREKELRTELRLQRAEDNYAQLLTAVGKMQASLDDIKNTVRSAVGRGR